MVRLLRRPIVWLPISVALLGLLLWRSQAWRAGETLARVDIAPLALAVLLNVPVALLWAARSADLFAAAGRPIGIGPLIPMTVFANTINNVTPGSMGELVRLYLLRAHHGVDLATGGAVIVIERLVAFGYLAGSALVLWLGHVWGLPLGVEVAAVLAVIAAPPLVYAAGVRPAALVASLPAGRLIGAARWQRFGTGLRRLDGIVARLVTDIPRAGLFALFTAGIFASYTGQLVLVGRAFGIDLDPLVAWGILGLGITVGVLSLLPFGLGSTDLVVGGLLVAAGVPELEATAIVLANRVVGTLPLGLAGVVSYAVLSASLPDSSVTTAAAMTARDLEAGDDA